MRDSYVHFTSPISHTRRRTADELGGGQIWSRLEKLLGPTIFPRFEDDLPERVKGCFHPDWGVRNVPGTNSYCIIFKMMFRFLGGGMWPRSLEGR